MNSFLNILSHFTSLDYVIFSVNLLLFIFSKPIVAGFKNKNENRKAKLLTLRVINIVLIILYINAFFFDHITRQISQTGLTLLISFIVVHFTHVFI